MVCGIWRITREVNSYHSNYKENIILRNTDFIKSKTTLIFQERTQWFWLPIILNWCFRNIRDFGAINNPRRSNLPQKKKRFNAGWLWKVIFSIRQKSNKITNYCFFKAVNLLFMGGIICRDVRKIWQPNDSGISLKRRMLI